MWHAGTTPLLCAVVDHNDAELVEVLLKYGARIDMTDNTGLNPVDAAAILDKPNLVQILLKYEKLHPADPSSFVYHEKNDD